MTSGNTRTSLYRIKKPLSLRGGFFYVSIFTPALINVFGVSGTEALASRRLGEARCRNTELDHIFPYLGLDIGHVLLNLLFILALADQDDILVLYYDIVLQTLQYDQHIILNIYQGS